MPDGPGGFAQDFSCPALLRMPLGPLSLRIPDCHRLWLNFPEHSTHDQGATAWSYNPGDASPQPRFGLFPVRSPLLGESLVYFLFLGVLRCFSSPRLPLYTSCTDNYPSGNWVVPFGNPWIKGYLLLPMAYRSLSRPSSPPRAKASTRRPNFLSPLLIPIKRNKVAHTISCNFEIITQFLKTKSSLLTVLCVNMSKISKPTRLIFRPKWRITDSNR